MRCLFFVVLVYAVRCDDGNYYVIQVPRDEPQRTLKVYWNVPTMQCKSKKVVFENLYQKYGIHQNDGDQFRGEMVTIMYDPGLFPALLKNETSGKFKFRNGGVPQEGDLDKHLEAFRKDLDFSIPDQNFKGIGIIDFESWRPIYRQNFGVLSPYKDVSYEIERKLHWWWPKSTVEAEAKRRFESSARTFMESTISLARQLRPGGVWGFYGFPYCFNMASNNMVERCANKVPEENDRLSWLWRSSTALYPSVYSPVSLTTSQLAALIRGRVREARRVKRGVVLPYFWYRYRDGGFLTQTDLNAALNELYKSNASGFIIWGSSSDVDTLDKCKKLYNYVQNIFGPAVAKYTKKALRDEVLDGYNTTTTALDNNKIDATNNATIELSNRPVAKDPNTSDEIHMVNKINNTDDLNSTSDIKKEIQKEITKKFNNYVPINEDNTSEEEEAVLKNNNVLIDLIINSILNREFNSLSSHNESTPEYNLTNAVSESSLFTKDNVDIMNHIDEKNYLRYANQSTTDKNTITTTEPINITNNNDMQTLDYNYKEIHKETAQIDTTTDYNLDTRRSFIENNLATETTVTNSIDKASDFKFDANNSTDNFDILRTLSTIDFTTTEIIKLTVDFENTLLNEQDEFENSFTLDDISTTDNILQKNSEKDIIFTRINTGETVNESEFNETDSEFSKETEFKKIGAVNDFTEKINQLDVTTKSYYYFGTIEKSEKSESLNIITKTNCDIDDQKTVPNLEKALASTEDYADFDETTVSSTISTMKGDTIYSIEDSTVTVNSKENLNKGNFDLTTTTSTVIDSKYPIGNIQETINYANFDHTTTSPIGIDNKSLKEDNTKIANSQDTRNFTNFDQTTVTLTAVDNTSLMEDSTEIANNQETINYANFDETTATSTAVDSKYPIENSTATVNSQETTNYASFDKTTGTSIADNREEDSTATFKNGHETVYYNNIEEISAISIANSKAESTTLIEDSTSITQNVNNPLNYANFDETTAISIVTPKAESQSSIEDSTAVSATEDKVVVYVL